MFPSRREFILAFALVLVSAVEGNAAGVPKLTPADRLKMWNSLSKAVGAAAGAMTALAAGVASLGTAAGSELSKISAYRTRSRLTEISARATQLANENQITVINRIDDYLKNNNPTPADWLAVTQALGTVISDVKDLLDELKNERSGFNFQPAYKTLMRTIDPGQLDLSKLQTLPPPTTQEEREKLSEIRTKYKNLLEQFEAAVEQLNAYIQKH
jgi:hypothetical protein